MNRITLLLFAMLVSPEAWATELPAPTNTFVVFFAHDSTELNDGMRSILDDVVEILYANRDTDLSVDLTTFYDSKETALVGQKRAEAVQTYLSNKGVGLFQVSEAVTEPGKFGTKERPRAFGSSRFNRRAELFFK